MYDESKAPPLTSPDTDNATSLHENDIDDDMRKDNSIPLRKHYKRLKKLNTGRWNGKWRNESHQRVIENLAMYDAIASQLGLTERQKGIGRSRFLIPDFRRYSQMGGVRVVAFCICKLVCGEDGRDYYPTRKRENNDPLFVNIADDIGLTQRNIEKVIPKLQSELDTKFGRSEKKNMTKRHN
jgi:hypothetical protein